MAELKTTTEPKTAAAFYPRDHVRLRPTEEEGPGPIFPPLVHQAGCLSL